MNIPSAFGLDTRLGIYQARDCARRRADMCCSGRTRRRSAMEDAMSSFGHFCSGPIGWTAGGGLGADVGGFGA